MVVRTGDGLGALRDGVLRQLTGEDEPHSGLDLAGGDRGLLRVRRELCNGELEPTHSYEYHCARTGSLGRDTLENVVDEGVEDGHRLVRDTRIGVDLLEDCVTNGRQLKFDLYHNTRFALHRYLALVDLVGEN